MSLNPVSTVTGGVWIEMNEVFEYKRNFNLGVFGHGCSLKLRTIRKRYEIDTKIIGLESSNIMFPVVLDPFIKYVVFGLRLLKYEKMHCILSYIERCGHE